MHRVVEIVSCIMGLYHCCFEGYTEVASKLALKTRKL